MKRKVYPMLACLSLAGLLTVGCETLQLPGDQAKLDRIETISKTATYIPVTLYLLEHPQDHLPFVLANEAINALLLNETIDPGALAATLEKVPMDELRAKQVSVLLTGGMLLINDASGGVTVVDNAPRAKAAAIGIRDGLTMALKASGVYAKPPE